MDKLTMAHEYALEMLKETIPTGSLYGDEAKSVAESIVSSAFALADMMQAEADKRKPKPELPSLQQTFINGVEQPRYAPTCEEWQPDWSQAPNDAKYWAMDKDHTANFFKNKPEITNGNGWDFGGVMQSNNSHNYQGNWQDSLRKRPSNI